MKVVKWSACSPYTLTIRVRILRKSTIFLKIVAEKNENKQKEAAIDPLKTVTTIQKNSGHGTFGQMVNVNTRDLQFKSSLRFTFIFYLIISLEMFILGKYQNFNR